MPIAPKPIAEAVRRASESSVLRAKLEAFGIEMGADGLLMDAENGGLADPVRVRSIVEDEVNTLGRGASEADAMNAVRLLDEARAAGIDVDADGTLSEQTQARYRGSLEETGDLATPDPEDPALRPKPGNEERRRLWSEIGALGERIDDLRQRAETDPAAAEELQRARTYQKRLEERAAGMRPGELGVATPAGMAATGAAAGATAADYDPVEARRRTGREEWQAEIARRERMQAYRDVSELAMRTAAKLPLNITRGVLQAVDNALGLFTDFETQAVIEEVSPEFGGYFGRIEEALGKPGADDQMIREMTQWGVGFAGWLKGLKVLSGRQVATLGQVVAAEAATAFTTLDPHIGRFSELLQEVGLESDLIDYLASPGETEVEDRFKNAVEGAGLAAGLPAIILGGARSLREAYRFGKEIEFAPSGSGMGGGRQGGAEAASALLNRQQEAPNGTT